jgi:hypothetical protein
MPRQIYKVKRCGADCAAEYDPCGPVEPESCLQCRSKGSGYATFCGFIEFSDDGFCHSPPRWYKTKSLSGSFAKKSWGNTACAENETPPPYFEVLNITENYSGNCTKAGSGAGCTTSSYASRLVSGYTREGVTGETINDLSGSYPVTDLDLSYWSGDYSVSSCLSRTFTADGLCYTGVTPGAIRCTGEATESLSSEDTEDDARGRIDALSWSAWSTGCIAKREQRASEEGSQTFQYQPVQWRVYKAGLLPSTTYAFVVTYWRRAIGSSTWELYQTLELEAASDSEGLLATEATDVPNAEGYETEARSACVLTPVG